MKASKYNNKKHYKKQKTRKHNKKNNKKNHKKHNNKSRRKLKRNSKKRRYSRRKKIKGGKTFPIFYDQNETLGNIYPLSKTGIPAGGNELAQRAEPVYQAGQLKGGASNIPLTGEITNVFRSGIHSISELGRGAIGDNPGTNPSPTADHFNHTGGTGAKGNVNNMTYLDSALIAANSATRSY
tara:strand:+ start:277 stop:822 length:546 start_codon:yes stop_codon:yes gene_type:complete